MTGCILNTILHTICRRIRRNRVNGTHRCPWILRKKTRIGGWCIRRITCIEMNEIITIRIQRRHWFGGLLRVSCMCWGFKITRLTYRIFTLICNWLSFLFLFGMNGLTHWRAGIAFDCRLCYCWSTTMFCIRNRIFAPWWFYFHRRRVLRCTSCREIGYRWLRI